MAADSKITAFDLNAVKGRFAVFVPAYVVIMTCSQGVKVSVRRA